MSRKEGVGCAQSGERVRSGEWGIRENAMRSREYE